jgi:hypothetical protein
MNEISLTVIQIASGILVESIIIGFIFQMIASKSNKKSEDNIGDDLKLIQKSIDSLKVDLINQIKESQQNKKG